MHTQQRRKNKLAFASVFLNPHLYTRDAVAQVKTAFSVRRYPNISDIKLMLFWILLKVFQTLKFRFFLPAL